MERCKLYYTVYYTEFRIKLLLNNRLFLNKNIVKFIITSFLNAQGAIWFIRVVTLIGYQNGLSCTLHSTV